MLETFIFVFIGVPVGCMLLLWVIEMVRPMRWTCEVLGWHNGKGERSFDGASVHSTCGKCGQPVMQNSNGNWF